jgi:ATP-binding cassette subfamily B protein
MRSGDQKPKVTRALLLRVLAYARPYRWQIAGMLVAILLTTALSLVTPLIFRRMIDVTIPSGNVQGLALLALALLLVPLLSGGIGVAQRRLNAAVGEGVIFDLRVALFARLQRMSLRFFTNTKVGELMSRLNNDVVGAQNAISNTIVNIVTDVIETVALLAVMLALNWQLTLVSVIILPLFILAARKLGLRLRDMARQQMELNAQMNAHMSETLNIGGALLVKLFGRGDEEVSRFRGRAAAVRDSGVSRAVLGSSFFAIIGLVSAVGTALVYGLGGWYVIEGVFTVGTIVAFGSYLGMLYGSLQGLVTAPVDFSTSMVSFERVFEVLDLPPDIGESPAASSLEHVRGELEFGAVTFRYNVDESRLLSEVRRYGSMENVKTVISGQSPGGSGQSGLTGSQVPLSSPEARDNGRTGELEGGDTEATSQAREVALDSVSFHAAPGQLVALVGPSGAGKTTLTYLIPRLYDPTAGVIRIDGHDLRSLTLDSLAAAIGMVTQETYLFHDTIRTNLT